MANTGAATCAAAPALLLVVADPARAAHLSELLWAQLGAAVTACETPAGALAVLEDTAFDCVVISTTLSDAEALPTVGDVATAAGDVPVVVIDGTGADEDACAALAVGAHDVVPAADAAAELSRCARRAMERAAADRRRRDLAVAPLELRDRLTGLASPLLFTERLERAITRMARHTALAAVLFVDLDDLDAAGETLTGDMTDAVLKVVAHRLEGAARESDTVARIGAREFLVLCEDLSAADDAAVVAERLQLCIGRPIEIDGHLIEVSASIGVAMADRTMTAERVLRRGDIALSDASELVASVAREATPASENPGPRMLQESLERALTVEAFSLAFQPVTDLPSGRLVAVEALLRWDDGDRIRQPDEFLPVAEASGLIVPIGGWVLREACATLAGWRARGEVEDDVVVSVNLAARQLCDERLFTHVVDALDAADLPAENLAVEITETTLIGDPEMAMTTLARLKELGVAVWLDDFGTGYSSLSYLDQYPVDAIKLDRSFLRKLGDRRGRALLIMVSDLAARLGIAAIAEGVETEEQRQVVARLGFTAAQGFYLGQPQLTIDLLGATDRH